MGAPPSSAGASKVTEADELPAAAAAVVGASGAATGTNEFDDADRTPVPIAFVAVTVHV